MSTTDNLLPNSHSHPTLPGIREPHVLPPVMRMIERIDKVLTRYVGPIATELGHEEFERWRNEGQVGPAGLHRYISRLARYIGEDAPRREFIGLASRCIQLARTRD